MHSSEATPAHCPPLHICGRHRASTESCVYQRRKKRFCSLGKEKDQLIRPKEYYCGPSKGALCSDCLDKLKYSSLVCQTLEGEKTEEGVSFLLSPKDWRGVLCLKDIRNSDNFSKKRNSDNFSKKK